VLVKKQVEGVQCGRLYCCPEARRAAGMEKSTADYATSADEMVQNPLLQPFPIVADALVPAGTAIGGA
jgi:hypothetical protein